MSDATAIATSLPAAAANDRSTATTWSIGAAVGLANLSFALWSPFLPLYLIELGATSDANAVFWVAMATSVQGVARLISGPLWGLLSDRVGRKAMFLRALFFASLTASAAAAVNAPWQLTLAFSIQGLMSGFTPAAVALTSVTVPDQKLNSSLATITGFQYLANTIGPAFGSLLVILLGFRGAIILAAALPALSGLAVLQIVPNDRAKASPLTERQEETPKDLEPFRVNAQFLLVVFAYFVVFSLVQLIRLITPIAMVGLVGEDGAKGVSGIAFTIGGVASTISVFFAARYMFQAGRYKLGMAFAALTTAGSYLIIAFAGSPAVYVLGFALNSLMISAMVPAIHTLIAANTPKSRRGTAFGFAGSAQALSFMAGPLGAALIVSISITTGMLVLAGVLLGLAVLLLLALKEPASLQAEPKAA